jgi:hypothetical protein
MLNSICESIVITQGSVYTKPSLLSSSISSSCEKTQDLSHSLTPSKRDRIEITDRWHDQTVIHGSSTTWRSPMKSKIIDESSQISRSVSFIDANRNRSSSLISTRDIALSPVDFSTLSCSHCTTSSSSTSPLIFHDTVDRSCQCSPCEPIDVHCQDAVSSTNDRQQTLTGRQSFDNESTFQVYPDATIRQAPTHMTILERSADSGIFVDVHHRTKCHFGLQVEMKSSSSDSDDPSEIIPHAYRQPTSSTSFNQHANASSEQLEQEIVQLRREREHVLDLLAMNWNRSNIWIELTEAKLNYIIGETGEPLSIDEHDDDDDRTNVYMSIS